MSSLFSASSVGIPEKAVLWDAVMFGGWDGRSGVKFKWIWQFDVHKSDSHVIMQDIELSKDQARALHEVLGRMLDESVIEPAQTKVLRFISYGKAESVG